MTTENTSTRNTSSKINALAPRLMGFARLIQTLANRFKGVAKVIAISGILSALLITALASRSWDGNLLRILLASLLLLPGLIVGWCWYVLDEAVNLPQRLSTWLGDAGGYAGELRKRFKGDETGAETPGRFTDLRKLAGLTYEIASLGIDSRDLLAILGSSLSLTNPLFLVVILVAAGVALLLDLTALVWGLIALF